MAKFQVKWWIGKNEYTVGPFNHVSGAQMKANEVSKGARVVTILRDSEGADHPDNKGKYFLYMIVK